MEIRDVWKFEQVSILMRMYPNDSHKRLSIAQRIAEEFPAILADLGEEKTHTVEKWLELQGLQVREKRRDSWGEVAFLFWLLLRGVQWRQINPKEVFRVMVWSMMGFKP
jgi:hypothetical protein